MEFHDTSSASCKELASAATRQFNAIQIQNLTSRRTNEDPLIVWHEDYSINPVWHGIGKQEKCSSLEQPSGNFYQT